MIDSRALPPTDRTDWQTQALPDAWAVNHAKVMAANLSDALITGWYRLSFKHPTAPTSLHAVYLPKLGLNAAVFLNGQAIGDGGAFQEPFGRNWNRPLLFPLPPNVLHPGENTLYIRVLAHAYTQANLDPVFVGTERQLRPWFERNQFWRITLNQSASLMIAAMGVLMLVLWWQRKQETAYGYFGLSALVWAAQSTNLYLKAAPLSTAPWEILVNSSFQVFSALLLISLLRFAAAGGRPLIPLLWGSVFASPATQALAPAPHFLTVTAFWHVFTLLCALATLVFLLRAAIRWHNRDAALLSMAMGLVVVLAGHDWIMHSQHFWHSRPEAFLEDIYLLHYSAPLVFLAIGVIMTSRFVRILNEFESLNSDLESRVKTKHAELQSSYERMRGMEMQRAITEERERIYRDLHDDVGAKLLSLVYRADSPDNAQLARSALQELRDVVSTTHPENLSLNALSADWRAECEQRLSEAGLALDWQAHDALEEFSLSQPQALNLSRILRESISNLIKHAQATRAWVELRIEGYTLSLCVRDDGCGCEGGSLETQGRGLRNMQNRAERIGARLIRRNGVGGGGCEILISLPLGDGRTET